MKEILESLKGRVVVLVTDPKRPNIGWIDYLLRLETSTKLYTVYNTDFDPEEVDKVVLYGEGRYPEIYLKG